MILYNDAMGRHIENLLNIEINLPCELNDLISAGFKEKSGGVFFAALFTGQIPINLENKSFFDLSGFEYTANKIHVEDYCLQSEVFPVAFKFLRVFEGLWLRYLPSRRCIAIVSYQVDNTLGNIAVFTFYIDRPSEMVIDLEKLDEFKEPIFVKLIN